MKILVIDDDYLVRRMVARILVADGHVVVTAENGLRGMELLATERPQMVITDIIMPEQEGIETILAIRRDKADVKIIAISGGSPIAGSSILKMAQLLGADDVIQKPFRADDLKSRVRALGASSATEGSLPN